MNPRREKKSILKSTLQLREASRGMRLTAASAWFRYRPERWRHEQEAPSERSDPSSLSSISTPGAQTESTATGGSAHSLRAVSGFSAITSDVEPILGSSESDGQGEAEVELETWVPAPEIWEDVTEEFRNWHYRASVFLRGMSRQLSHAAMASTPEPEELIVMREVNQLREDLEWHLQHASLQCPVDGVSAGESLRTLESPEIHSETQPMLHTRFVSHEEIRENLEAWRIPMQTEYDSLLAKGAVAEVAESEVQKWISEGRDVEILPGRGVPSEKPPTSIGGRPRKKYRAVICGNFQRHTEERSTETFYAGGADSISIRTCLRWGGLHGHGVSGVDIKTAF